VWVNFSVPSQKPGMGLPVPQFPVTSGVAVGGKICEDHNEKCKDKLGGQDLPAVTRDMHVEGVLWTDALTKQTQKNAASGPEEECTVHRVS
jgi:hypothetical protein